MPSLGADMDQGTVLEWLVKPGDVVHKGDLVAVVDTAKSAVDVETFEDGVVERLLVEPGRTVDVGTPLALIAAEGAAAVVPAAVVPAAAAEAPPGPPVAAPPVTRPQVIRPRAAHPTASPVVRRFAKELDVDLDQVVGTGKGGRVTHADVELAAAAREQRPRITPYARRRARELGVDLRALPATPGRPLRARDVETAAPAVPTQKSTPVPAAVPAKKPTPVPAPVPARTPAAGADRAAAMRSAIATLMARSAREIPHYYLTDTVDLGAASEWLRRHNEGLPVSRRVVAAALFCKATARAAREVPELNGYWENGAFRPAEEVHVGLAVSLRGGGLVTPAIHDAADLPVPELMDVLRDLVQRARRGVLHRREMTEGTITVTNLGERGAESVLGVIFPPQVALLGFGRVVERPWAEGGLLGVRPTVTVTLAADHRASDGHTGGRLLEVVRRLLASPEEL